MGIFLLLSVFLLVNLPLSQSSAGDKSRFYSTCVSNCIKNVCDQGFHTGWLWTCSQNCDYECQWETVSAFHARNYDTPQFFGKWPFIRILGFQEPASAFFSLVNLIIAIILTRRFCHFVPSDSPYYLLWMAYSLIISNAWFWSIVYHTRENEMTERMDYTTASMFVFFSSYVMSVRLFELQINLKGILWTAFAVAIILRHVYWLWDNPLNYDQNLKFNVVIGGIGVIGWLVFSWKNKRISHAKYVAWYSIGVTVCTLFELLDFPPIFWIFDAHSVWHFMTAFLTILIYQFMTYDCLYLRANSVSSQSLPTFHKLE